MATRTAGQNQEVEKLSSQQFALQAAELVHNTRCENVVVLDLRGRSPVTEFFVIATGTSPRQMRTAVEEVQDLGKKVGFAAWQTSGLETGRWILLDCVHVVCHVFDAESRDFYDLELLWGDCPRLDWRKELGLPPEEELPRRRARFEPTGLETLEAEEEEARLEGDAPEEEGDGDVDEEAEADAPVVVELPDESTGSNSVEFVEIDPPAKRRSRGRAVYPTPIADEEDTTEEERAVRPVDIRAAASQSADEDESQRDSEAAANRDVEAVSAEDLPEEKLRTRPMGGVSAGMSSTLIGDDDEEQQTQTHGSIEDAEQDHKDEIPEAHERAAETTAFAKGTEGRRGVYVSAESAGERPRSSAITSRKDYGKPVPPRKGGVDVKKAKAGVVRTAAGKRKAAASRKPAAKTAKKAAPSKTKSAAKKAAPAKSARAKKTAKKSAKKPAKKK